MPKLNCICGESINLSEVPNKNGFKLLHEEIIEDFLDSISDSSIGTSTKEELKKKVYRIFFLGTPGIMQVYECPTCGRLAIFGKASGDKPDFWYKQEIRANNEIPTLVALTKAQKANQRPKD